MATQIMMRCGFCRRITTIRTGAGSGHIGQGLAQQADGAYLPDDVLITEVYCRDCEQYYQQLITFERREIRAADWNTPGPPNQESSRSMIAAGSPS